MIARLVPAPIPSPDNGDPDALQHRAADPGRSVWVAASAGSGKTKVLTDRVLRLLLPRGDGRPGVAVDRILCLTFTKAGAAEMTDRITAALAEWAVQDEAKLHGALTGLLPRPPGPADMEAARRLFAQVLDSPGGLKIMTLHSFCQSVLGRFPLEAGVAPHVAVADDNIIRPLQQNALAAALEQAQNDPGGALAESLQALGADKGEADITALLQAVIGERGRMAALLRRYGDIDGLRDALCAALGVDRNDTPDTLLAAAFADDAFDRHALRDAAAAMGQIKGKRMQERAPRIHAMLAAQPEDRPDVYVAYRGVFLTGSDEVYADSHLFSKGLPDSAIAALRTEAARLAALEDRLKTVQCARRTVDLLRLALAVMAHYRAEKTRHGVMDYDDLIDYTLRLLSGESLNTTPRDAAAWVMYKLDQGIDHILVDEAQDTNPEQWDIVHALCGEFFAGDGARADTGSGPRTVFAVGDEKQSIFGFQRAAPEKFRAAETRYADSARAAGLAFDSVPMRISFRSTAPVLAVTDATFDTAAPWAMLGLPQGDRVQHSSHRRGQAGRVELWPLIETHTAPDPDPWALPLQAEDTVDAEAALCDRIAASIRRWLDEGEILPSRNRAVQPGDIMILVKSRGTMVDRLVRALKAARVPVSGIDRMMLNDQIAVQDVLAVAQFALMPEDDLALACLLKSPLAGLDEDALAALAIARKGSLWQAVKTQADPVLVAWLKRQIAGAGTLRPYEFFSALLHAPCPADPLHGSGWRAMIRRLGEDCRDPLEEFLNATLTYESANTPSLQQFLRWQADGNTAIKREMDAAGDMVRIMTVHASKGLQAPIVILPDTAHTQEAIERIKAGGRVLWAERHDGPALPFWSPRAEADCPAYAALLTARKARLAEEYRRLLYVALTRAADRLYVAGCMGSKTPSPECWHALVEAGFNRLDQHVPDGMTLTTLAEDTGAGLPAFRLDSAQSAPPDKAARPDTRSKTPQPACADWGWIDAEPVAEENPPRPLTPSRPSAPDPAPRSPLQAGGTDSPAPRFRRGLVTHTLLQILPSIAQDRRRAAATGFVAGHDFSPEMQAAIVDETLAVLDHPDFAPVFGPGSMAEVPVTAMIDGRLISGQIDRLLVTPERILIVDYKTNRPPPQDARDIPAAYRSQLRAYRDVLSKIYPGREIACALLWTDGPRMMEIAL